MAQSHKVDTEDGGTITIQDFTQRKAIKAFCTACLGWETHPKDCTSTHCPLFPYRGKTLSTRFGDE